VSEETSVHELKVLVANELDIPVERQRLVFKGKPMHGTLVCECFTCVTCHSDRLFLGFLE